MISYAGGQSKALPALFDGARGSSSFFTVSSAGQLTKFPAYEANFLGGVRVGVIE